MQGIAGSGKSTFVARIADHPGAVVLSADHYFEKGGEYRFDPSKLVDAHAECMRHFIEAIHLQSCLVVVDNTNTTAVEIAPYYSVAKAYGAEVEIVSVSCDPEVGAARNTHGAPLAVCKAMAQRIAECSIPPYWDVKFTKV